MKKIANEAVRVIVEKIHPRDPQLRAKSLIALEQQNTAALQFAAHAADAVAWGYGEKFAASLCAEHVQQLGSESLLSDLMEVKD